MPVEEQVASIYSGTRGFLDGLAVSRVGEFEAAFLDALRAEGTILGEIREKREITKENDEKLKNFLADFTKKFA
jgi:F-type H+-transporting ATPase subunit alpha